MQTANAENDPWSYLPPITAEMPWRLTEAIRQFRLISQNSVEKNQDEVDLSPDLKWEGNNIILRGLTIRLTLGAQKYYNISFYRCSIYFEATSEEANVFHNCSFFECSMLGPHKIIHAAHSCLFYGCDISEFRLRYVSYASFISCNLSRLNIRGSSFGGGYLYECNLHHANFAESNIDSIVFVRCIGIDTIRGAARYTKPEADEIHEPVLGPVERYLDWDRLRWIGQFPFFGLSTSALIAQPALIYLISVYNMHIEAAQGALSRIPKESHLYEAASAASSKLATLPPPSLSIWLLIGTVLMFIGSSAFSIGCPARVRQYTYQQWIDEIKGSPLTYLPLAWSRRWLRVFASITLIVGGIISFVVLAIKLYDAAVYVVRYGELGWPTL